MADSEITDISTALSGDAAAGTELAYLQSADGNTDYKMSLAEFLEYVETNATAFQAADADLDTWAGITPSANAQSLVGAADYAAMRALLDLEPGTDVEAVDADILRADTSDQLTAAFTAAVDDDGAQGGNTYTPSVAAGSNYKKIVNDGAITLNPPSPATGEAITLSLLVVNTTGAGAINASGFTMVTGDSFSTTTTDEFLCRIEVYDIGGTEYSHLDVVALQ